MTLKTKSQIYRLTGIYLAEKEELAHVSSKDAQQKINELIGSSTWASEDFLDVEEATAIVIGLWQVEHKFHRPLCFLRFRRPAFFWKPIAFFVEAYKSIF